MSDSPRIQHVQVLRAPDRWRRGFKSRRRARQHRYTVLENGIQAEMLRIEQPHGVVLSIAYSYIDALGWRWHHERGCNLRPIGDTRIECYRNGVRQAILELVEVESC